MCGLLDQASGMSMAMAWGRSRPAMKSNSRALSKLAESLPPGAMMGKSFSISAPNSGEARTDWTEEAGLATSVSRFSINGVDYSSQIGSIFGTSTIGARQSITGCMTLSSVSAPIYEAFNFSGPGWSTAINMSFQGPQAQLAVGGATNAASYAQTYAPGMIMAVFGTGLGTLSQ